MRQLLLALVVLALPVAGTLGGIVVHERALRGATVWRIPITGYDPLDPLRGRYLAFRYRWEARGDQALCARGVCRLYLEEGGRQALVTITSAACPAPVDLAASGLMLDQGRGADQGHVFASARLWVSEASAPLLERQLRARPMVAVARLTQDGRLIAERLEPVR